MLIIPEMTQAFWQYMLKEFDAKVEQKDEAAVMQAAAVLLYALNIQDKDQFLKNFVTTLHKTIYIPFKIGVDDGRWSLWSQVRVCVHECQHTVQGAREGWVAFDGRYLTSSSWRAGYEAECYGCDMEMEFWRQGKNFDPFVFAKERAQGLKNYGCDDADIDQAAATLAIRASVISQGVVETRAAQVAIPWLEKNALGLKEVQGG